MHLLSISRTVRGGTIRLTGLVQRGDSSDPTDVWFEFPEVYADWVPESADPFAAALLVPAMMAQEPLILDPPISPLLLGNLSEIRNIFAKWYPELLASTITATAGQVRPPAAEPRAATFFSGGVDSFYTLLKRLGPDPLPEPLTHLIYMRGIETPLEAAHGTEASSARIELIAATLGIEVIAGKTNIRTFFNRHWERYYLGSGLAATAIALGGGFRSICIPSADPYSRLKAQGSTPLTDPLFSSEYLRIVHDGAEVDRSEKVARAISWDPDTVRANLRVCMGNSGGDFNCGTCYKCVRTAIVLDLLGHLDTSGLSRSSDRSRWPAALRADQIGYNKEALALAVSLGTRPDLLRILRRTVDRHERFDAMVRLIKHSPLVRLLPVLRAVRDRLGVAPRVHKV